MILLINDLYNEDEFDELVLAIHFIIKSKIVDNVIFVKLRDQNLNESLFKDCKEENIPYIVCGNGLNDKVKSILKNDIIISGQNIDDLTLDLLDKYNLKVYISGCIKDDNVSNLDKLDIGLINSIYNTWI